MRNLRFIKITMIALLVIFACALLLCACDISAAAQPAAVKTSQELSQSCIRIHIRANSNSEKDQSVKLKVRDGVTEYLEDKLAVCKTKSEAAAVLEREKKNLVKIADSTLYNNNFEYKTSISIKKEYFPDRRYDGYDFPAGYYDAMVINLGTGNGDNWWCVAFPPLCFIPDGNDGEKIVYKSWVKEMLDKIFD